MGESCDALYRKVLQRYPECPELPELPKGVLKWGEAEFDIFIQSMGFIVPQVVDKFLEQEAEDVTAPANAAGETQVGEACIKYLNTADASLVIPSTIYMEDRAPVGLKLESILTKFDRCRAAALQSLCGVNLKVLADDYGVGILLSDLTILLQGPPPALISKADVESEIDLPKLPVVASRQRLVDSEGATACTASFGQLLVDLRTKRLSGNTGAYNRLKLPCDRVFSRDVPNATTLAVREELAAKLAAPFASQGGPFRPTRYVRGSCVICPSDCDMYDTMYHPKAPTLCERACLSTGEKFCLMVNSAFFVRFLAPLPPGLLLAGHIFLDDTDDTNVRCLIALENVEKGDGSCALTAFSVYGGPLPGALFNEEVQATTPKVAQGLVKWAKEGSAKDPEFCDLSLVRA